MIDCIRGSAMVVLLAVVGPAAATGCDDSDAPVAWVEIENDFDNPEMDFQPPWTICQSSYRGVEFGKIERGATSAEQEVAPGLDYVLMVAAWNNPNCDPGSCLPIASRNEEEVVDGQHRTIHINLPNHQGPCPPEGVQPIPQELYDRIRELWPEYGFLPYEQKTENPQCGG